MILGLTFIHKDNEDIFPVAFEAMKKIADEVIILHQKGEFDDGKHICELLEMARPYNPEWLVFFDADEEYSPELKDVILSIPKDINTINVDILYCLAGDKKLVMKKSGMNRACRNLGIDYLIKSSRRIPAFHGGKIGILPEDKRVFDSHALVYHYQCRTYEQTMKKYEFYKKLDPECKYQSSYEHLKELAMCLKHNDYSRIKFIC